jgi:hypothetical protein
LFFKFSLSYNFVVEGSQMAAFTEALSLGCNCIGTVIMPKITPSISHLRVTEIAYARTWVWIRRYNSRPYFHVIFSYFFVLCIRLSQIPNCRSSPVSICRFAANPTLPLRHNQSVRRYLTFSVQVTFLLNRKYRWQSLNNQIG